MPKKIVKPILTKQNKDTVFSKKQVKNNKIKQKKLKVVKSEDDQQNEDDSINNNDKEQINNQQKDQSINQSNSQQSNEQNQSDQDDQSSSQQSDTPLAPENYAIKQMQFRQRRGTKMNYLMNRKKQEEEDPFWQGQGQDYFGSLENQEEDQDYQQSSSGRDQFDSDFDQTQSEHSPVQNKKQQPVVDEQKAKQRKKQQQYMRKIGAAAQKKSTLKTNSSTKKKQVGTSKATPEVINRYIHQVCTQQQLLGQAAQTQYINWLSLQRLLSLQNQKKDFKHKQHFLDGPKIIYRDKISPDGIRQCTYQLVGVEVIDIAQLSQYMNKQGLEQ